MKDLVVLEGETATLSCVTSADCTSITWKKNNVTLLAGEKYEPRKEGKHNMLLIHRVEKDDTGVYMCDTGDMQSMAVLTVRGNSEKNRNIRVCSGVYLIYLYNLKCHELIIKLKIYIL